MLFGMPREAVDEKKQKHIYKTAKFFLHIHGLDNAYVRFDVIEIYLEENKYQLRHLKNVDINHKM